MHVLRSPALSPLRPGRAVPGAHDIVGAHETVFISLKIRRKKEMNFWIEENALIYSYVHFYTNTVVEYNFYSIFMVEGLQRPEPRALQIAVWPCLGPWVEPPHQQSWALRPQVHGKHFTESQMIRSHHDIPSTTHTHTHTHTCTHTHTHTHTMPCSAQPASDRELDTSQGHSLTTLSQLHY